MTSLLGGLRITELTAFLSGTSGSALLAQFGAEVIKLEEPRHGDPARARGAAKRTTSQLGDGRTAVFESANTDKRSIAVDLKTAAGKAIAHELIRGSDVFLSNYRPDVLRDLTLDWDRVRSTNPQVVYVTASGQGWEGPDAGARGFDWIGQALSGMMWAGGDRNSDEPTVTVGGPVDQSGGMLAALAIMIGLAARSNRDGAQRADVSLLGAGLNLMKLRLDQASLTGRSVTRHGRDRSRQPLANWYRCADDRWLLFCELAPDRFFTGFCATIGRPDLAEDERFWDSHTRRRHHRELITELDAAFGLHDRDDWLARFRNQLPDLAVAPVLDSEEALANEQARANGYVVPWPGHGAADPVMIGSPLRFPDAPARIERAAPKVGQDTEAILREVLGYSPARIEQLWEDGTCR